MGNYWLDEVKKRLDEESTQKSDVHLDRLREQGIIDERGEVTGQLRRWDAFLAITEVKHTSDRRHIEAFRCLKSVFGMPGGALLDISRDTMVNYLNQGKKIITAIRDERLGMWKEGCTVHLSANEFVLCDSAGDDQDNVGRLPEFQQTTSRL